MDSSKKGMERVLTAKNYAYFMESAMIDYYVKRNCTLRRVGKLLDDKGYAIALPKGGELVQTLYARRGGGWTRLDFLTPLLRLSVY